jgi:hypothetical protein
VIEKGQVRYSSGSGNGQLPQQDWPQNRLLSGAEMTGPPPIVLAGHVLDDKTDQPIPGAKVIPGYQPPAPTGFRTTKPILNQVVEAFGRKTVPFNERPFWWTTYSEVVSNGQFSVDFTPLSSTPILRVEAEGYLPYETDPIPTNTSSLVIRLKSGKGPNGVVFLPDGKPAEGATVLYAASQEQFGLKDRALIGYWQREAKQVTGRDGKFSLPIRAHGMTLYATHPSGWAEESVERGGDSFKLRLKPWAAVTGTLMHTNGTPAAGVELNVTVPSDWRYGEPRLNIQGRTVTDAQGRFLFVDVPPRRVEVQRIIPMNPNGWTYKLQTWLVAQPGITNNLGKVMYDQPPPLPALEQLKQRLGL